MSRANHSYFELFLPRRFRSLNHTSIVSIKSFQFEVFTMEERLGLQITYFQFKFPLELRGNANAALGKLLSGT